MVCQVSGKAAEKLAEKLQRAIVAKLQRIEVKTSLLISCMFRQIKRIIFVFLVLVNLLVVIPTPQFTRLARKLGIARKVWIARKVKIC